MSLYLALMVVHILAAIVAVGGNVTVALLGIFVYAPAVRRQIAEAERDPTSPAYAGAAARSNLLGVIVTGVVIVIVVLMVTKPG